MTERRYDPTRGEWVTFATHRQNRTFLPPADQCPLCPTAPGGPPTEIPHASYELVTFDNRFPSFTAHPLEPSVVGDALTPVEPAVGHAEVVVFTSDHDATLIELSVARLRALVDVWADRTTVLGRRPEIGYVFPFENKGEEIGVTLHHPHGQIYGYPDIPPIPAQEITAARRYRSLHGSCVWCDVVIREESSERLVVTGDAFAAYVPFWARFPYQVYISARRHAPALPSLTAPERDDLARVLKQVLVAYDGLFGFSMPYVMAVHQGPAVPGYADLTHLHLELSPPYRTATRRKYLAGSELAAGAYVTDLAPERTAAALRDVLAREVADDGHDEDRPAA
ncbi:galactose-1-phosphate uridylyltransferase [Actinoallomurus rhizosphaericola]|uniref:galactose-1-phosphate uridylyltransferase n=1 Tax=Actinoallomurus rhizosphaericola TaxID=2952536 RepID=UPI0020932F27|nr:galactose-1-phosphate uridylyltransferase [Actinoallomurus rhizosphaericola]MCO5996773.1 galactose-1-phosphate uridylyltransferase [Actinoallomurus rhizosphaericola]